MKQALTLLAALFLHFAAYGQQATTLTTNPTNVNGIRAAIDHPDLNGNADAIIIVDVVGYAHPLAVWYLANKWYVFNTDQANMSHRETFHVRYWTHSDANHFAHVVTQQNLRGNRSYIDSPALNNKPNAAVSIFQSMSNARGGYWNANEPTLEYDQADKKWYVVNKNGQPVLAGNAYNIVVEEVALQVITTMPPLQGTLLPDVRPKGAAGGDLTGNYPDPFVKGLRGREISSAAPGVGDTLRWNGAQWVPQPDPVQQTQALPASVGIPQTYFRTGERDLQTWSPIFGSGTKYVLAPLRHSFFVPKRSRLVISAAAAVLGPSCILPPCPTAGAYLYVSVDSNVDANVTGYSNIATSLSVLELRTLTLSNYMIDVPAGNHTVDLAIRHIAGTTGLRARPTYSSVMIIPLE